MSDADRAVSYVRPFSESASSDGVQVCARCQAVNPPEATTCACGAGLAGNQKARKRGLYAKYQPVELVMSAAEFEQGVVSDLGGVANLTTLERSYVRKLHDLEITQSLLKRDMVARGLLTPSGKVRDIHDAFLSGLKVFDRLAQRLGLARRARSVSLAEYLTVPYVDEAPSGAQDAPADAPMSDTPAAEDDAPQANVGGPVAGAGGES